MGWTIVVILSTTSLSSSVDQLVYIMPHQLLPPPINIIFSILPTYVLLFEFGVGSWMLIGLYPGNSKQWQSIKFDEWTVGQSVAIGSFSSPASYFVSIVWQIHDSYKWEWDMKKALQLHHNQP